MSAPNLYDPFAVGYIFGVVPHHDFSDDPFVAWQVNDPAHAAGSETFAEIYLVYLTVAVVDGQFVHVDRAAFDAQLDGTEYPIRPGHQDLVAVDAVIDLSGAQ